MAAFSVVKLTNRNDLAKAHCEISLLLVKNKYTWTPLSFDRCNSWLAAVLEMSGRLLIVEGVEMLPLISRANHLLLTVYCSRCTPPSGRLSSGTMSSVIGIDVNVLPW